MSIKSEIERISGNVSDALAATAEMGANVPETASSNDLGMLIRSIPTGGGVTDYNDLENKPCYTEQGYILPETTVEFDPDNGEGFVADVVNVSVGNTYTVNWNGTEYTCVAQAFDLDGVSTAALGDVGAMTGGDSTGEPFVVLFFDSATAAVLGAGTALYALDGSTSVTLSIIGEMVHKLDEKYLPDTVAFLYCDAHNISNNYVYKSSDFSDANNRATNAYVRSLFLGNHNVLLRITGEDVDSSGEAVSFDAYSRISAYEDHQQWGAIKVVDANDNVKFYTAEYTG